MHVQVKLIRAIYPGCVCEVDSKKNLRWSEQCAGSTRLAARPLILGSQWTCYNRDFDINEVLRFAHLSNSNLHRLFKGGPSFEHRLLNVVFSVQIDFK